MMRAGLATLVALLAIAGGSTRARAQQSPHTAPAEGAVARVNASVMRVLAFTGADAQWTTSTEDNGANGPDANLRLSYGAGVAVRNDLVLTAKHVVWGGELFFVLPSGTNDAVPAQVVYSDAETDFALLAVDGRLPHVTALPMHAPRLPEVGADLWVSGFPIDPLEPVAAVARATLSRVSSDGRLLLSTEVNPGNSGGPVFDAHGTLLGLVVERGDPAQGVEGLATAEPASLFVAGYQRAARLPPPTFSAVQRAVAAATATRLRHAPVTDTTALEAVVAAVTDTTPPAERAIAAICAWGVVRHHLYRHQTNDVAALPPDERALVAPFVAKSVELARRAIADAPYLRSDFSFLELLLRTNGDPAEMARRVPHP